MGDDVELKELADAATKTEQARALYEVFRARRDALIVTLRGQGVTAEELRARTQLSHQRISQILTRHRVTIATCNDQTTTGGSDGEGQQEAAEVRG